MYEYVAGVCVGLMTILMGLMTVAGLLMSDKHKNER